MDGMETVPLRFNYRSGQEIIEASEVALGEERRYEAKAGYSGTIHFYKFPKGLEEQAEQMVKVLIPGALGRRKGRTLGDIAVLYVDKNDGDVIEAQVNAAGMQFIRVDRGAPLSQDEVHSLARRVRWRQAKRHAAFVLAAVTMAAF